MPCLSDGVAIASNFFLFVLCSPPFGRAQCTRHKQHNEVINFKRKRRRVYILVHNYVCIKQSTRCRRIRIGGGGGVVWLLVSVWSGGLVPWHTHTRMHAHIRQPTACAQQRTPPLPPSPVRQSVFVCSRTSTQTQTRAQHRHRTSASHCGEMRSCRRPASRRRGSPGNCIYYNIYMCLDACIHQRQDKKNLDAWRVSSGG